MNYHFTTTKAHFEIAGGKVLEIFGDDALETESTNPFKGNLDIAKFKDVIKKYGADKVAFVRMEATTNLIGGQPFSLANLHEVREVASKHNIPVIVDCSLISENAYFIKRREPKYKDASIADIVKEMMSLADMIYLSGRKSTCVRGGMIATNDPKYYEQLKAWLPVYEGFLTYGGMSSRRSGHGRGVGNGRLRRDQQLGRSDRLLRGGNGQAWHSGGHPARRSGGHVDAMKFLTYPAVAIPAGSDRLAVSRVRCAAWNAARLHGPRREWQRRSFGLGVVPHIRAERIPCRTWTTPWIGWPG